MFVFTITLENTKTGQIAPSLICRKRTEAEAHEYAEAAIAEHPELRVHCLTSRPA